VAGLLVFLVTVTVALASVTLRRPLGAMGGLTDEWYYLGANLRVHSVLGVGAEPFVTRPPGYPAFIAAVLLAVDDPGKPTFAQYLARGAPPVGLAQALLLAAAAWLLHAWMARRMQPLTAFAAALLFGTNPYSVLLAGLLHYDILHWVALLLSWMTFDWAAAGHGGRRPFRLALAGALWGLHTLLRPITFLVPPLLVLLLRRRGRRWREVAADGAVTAVAAALVIAPWTARNHQVAGRFVLVNEQGWAAFWGAAVVEQDLDPNHYQWDRVYDERFRHVYERVTGQATYDVLTYNRHHRALADAFRREALAALGRQPGIYLHNVARSMATLAFQMPTVFLDVFREWQRPPSTHPPPWYFGPGAAEYRPSGVATGFSVFMALLTGLAGVGIVRGLRERDEWLIVALAAFASVALAHALVYMDLMYYYVKVPFLFLFSSYALDHLHDRGRRWALALLGAASAALLALTLGA
jgi:hypothetical protein